MKRKVVRSRKKGVKATPRRSKTTQRPRRSASAVTGKQPTHQSAIALAHILVPIDFSEHSRKALQYAVPFAGQFKATIHLLHVVEPTVYPADFSFGQVGLSDVEVELRKKGEQELQAMVDNIIKGQVPAEAHVKTGLPFVEIVSYAQDHKMDLIVVATHGRTGVEHILFGSTAEKIVRKAPCPVLVVRTKEHDFVDERV